MTGTGEFGGGLVVAWLSILSLGSRYWHWAGAAGRLRKRPRFLVFPAIAVCVVLAYFVANDMKGQAPWSHIPHAWKAMLIASRLRATEFPIRVWEPPSVIEPTASTITARPPRGSVSKPPEFRVISESMKIATEAGKDSQIFLSLKVDSDKPFEVQESRVAGTVPAGIDPMKIAEAEDFVWVHLPPITSEAQVQRVPSKNDSLTLPSSTVAMTPQQWIAFEAGQLSLLFAYHVVDRKGRLLLDFCGTAAKDGVLNVCKSHNGP
jgi:hypothetical protein